MTSEAPVRGLDNVVVANTRLSAIDGTAGKLIYAGYTIHDLAEQASFEEVAYLLWYGELPSVEQLAVFRGRLAAERAMSAAELALVRGVPAGGASTSRATRWCMSQRKRVARPAKLL